MIDLVSSFGFLSNIAAWSSGLQTDNSASHSAASSDSNSEQ